MKMIQNPKRACCFLLTAVLIFSAALFSAQAETEQTARLIGLLITRESLKSYVGEDQVLWGTVTQPGPEEEVECRFEGINALRLLCFFTPDESGQDASLHSNVDDGIAAVDFDITENGASIKMNAKIFFVPSQEETLFFYNPVLMTEDGRVFATVGDAMIVDAGMFPPGAAVGQTVKDQRTHRENGQEIVDTTEAALEIQSARAPLNIHLVQFSSDHELLQADAYAPGTVPETIVPLGKADYLLLETEERDGEGRIYCRREVFGREDDFLNTLFCREDGICLQEYHEILWEE